VRNLVRAGASGAVFVAMVLIGSVVLWVGVPLGWLWIASQIHYLSGSLGAAVGASLVGVVLTAILLLALLGWLSRTHGHLREARGLPSHGTVGLEAVMVISAGIATVLFVIWFFGYSGASPIPLHGGA
jgi:hypothetical protein